MKILRTKARNCMLGGMIAYRSDEVEVGEVEVKQWSLGLPSDCGNGEAHLNTADEVESCMPYCTSEI